jgi:hypothetical protein
VTWKFVHADKLDQPAVELWDSRGNFATIAIEDLVAHPPRVRGPGPVGGHWREWLADAYLEHDQLVVVTTGPHAYRIELTNGEIVERTHGGRGFVLWLLGTAMLFAIPVVVIFTFRRARRAARESAETEQLRSFRTGGKLFWVSALAPISLLLWLALDFAGLPAVPASVVDPMRSAVFAITLVLAPISIFGAALLPPGSKALRIAIAIAVPVILLAVRIAY